MRTVYLREKKSGNFELSNRKEATHKFNRKSDLEQFWNDLKRYGRRKRIVKAVYSKTQTYFDTFDQFHKAVQR